MSGFLPLLEAFAAFALTMVALTTAVSTILGIFQRLFRWRADGMRRLLIYFFRNEVKPLLFQVAGDGTPPAQSWAALDRDELPQFLVDMSFQPSSYAPDPAGSDPRLNDLVLPERDPAHPLSFVVRKLRYWSSLRRGIDALPPEEFVTRLKASTLYPKLSGALDAAALDARIDDLKARFIAHSKAATERFARLSRSGTVILGFLLAFSLNIDTFALLGRYLSDPKLTQDVLQQQETIVAKAQTDSAAAPVTSGTPSPKTAAEAKLDQATLALNQAAAAAAALAGKAADSDLAATNADLQAKAKAVAAAAADVQTDVAAATEATQAASETADALRSTLTDLTQAFPIGWTLYPACTNHSADLRCVALKQRVAKNAPPPEDAWNAIFWTLHSDTAGWLRWFGGALLMGLMLGLGTPFWIEVVNNFLRARDLVADTHKDTSKPETSPEAPNTVFLAVPAAAHAPAAPPAASGGRRVF